MTPPICLLLAKNDIVSNYDLSSLKFATCGAAPLSAELGRETMIRIPNLVIRQVYGLTETSPLSLIEPVGNTVDGSAGLLFPNMTAKIVDGEGNGKRYKMNRLASIYQKNWVVEVTAIGG